VVLEQAIITWIHLISASIWVGGSIFLGIILSPFLKTMNFSVQERIQIMIKLGRRFNRIAVPSLIILIITGLYSSQGIISKSELLLSTSYGQILLIKIFFVIALIITYIIHVRIINKKVENQIIGNVFSETQIQKLRKKIIILGEVTVVLSVIILFLASLLDAGI